jgi:hypothetical protein
MTADWDLEEDEDTNLDLEELTRLVNEAGRRIFVAQLPIDLRTKTGTNYPKVNRVYVLDLRQSGPGAAGGRTGGIGERKVERIRSFHCEKERWKKNYETDDAEKLEKFELPYHAASLGVTMPEGPEKVVTGVIDPELVEIYNEVAST